MAADGSLYFISFQKKAPIVLDGKDTDYFSKVYTSTKGKDGKWSHKPGGTKATLLDNAGHFILDPRTANRGMYTQFCTFMQVLHGHIKIK